ncbi:twin-arginine translocase subunit TatC [Henriciella marina]|uniref:Sec-independent protein translocase protein TatC n=1 Tax=Henriciella marina TaxID=453851 RepID=A0ABT4LX71_9PROT|nr:twin-arginine translocase subunit TatC [Henriciella marina]MCH2456476.1 twin-arginine translocase subunit TatC [Henriciella sp.]MCZ4298957.1 twin-arginine translocase subunit TatC [Henriciella marina]
MSKDMRADEQPNFTDEDSEMESSRAPLLDHLIELRTRLIWSIAALAGATLLCFFFARPLYNILLDPLVQVAELERGETRFELIYTAPLEVFFVELKLALFAGVFVAFPVMGWQIYSFVAPGLYKREKGAVLPFLIAAPVLFLLGALFVYWVMLPLISNFALSFEQQAAEGRAAITPQIKVSEYLSLVMALMLAFGLSFQLPVVLSLLGRAGIIGSDTLKSGRKYAVVGILVAAAFFTPPDLISQVMLAVPVFLLYEISIVCVSMMEKKAAEDDAIDAGDN